MYTTHKVLPIDPLPACPALNLTSSLPLLALSTHSPTVLDSVCQASGPLHKLVSTENTYPAPLNSPCLLP